ncbi:hypothetical protein [Dyella choica]|uniref:DUF883 family protein n=1 Tax=Dyella choica TaxID=1927959 RepID=A0A3S0R3M2_9GAMM|nr:hypothetical protein [Dyella choica]RUL75302.1 hypothetical protein EKH80_11280 [Dyella choica]
MSLFKQLKKVDQARQRVARHRGEMAAPAAALLERGYRHPLATVGAAAGAGFVLGSLGVGPLRVPGLVSGLSTGLAEIVAYGTRLIAELGIDAGELAGDSDEA